MCYSVLFAVHKLEGFGKEKLEMNLFLTGTYSGMMDKGYILKINHFHLCLNYEFIISHLLGSFF